MPSSSSAGSGYTTEGGDEDDYLPLSAGLSISQLELPDLITAAHMIHGASTEHFPAAVDQRMTGNGRGIRSGHGGSLHRKTEKMLEEMKSLRRQNVITHCLLGTMIVLTLGWQLSEVSIILTLKDGFTHPFRSIGKALSKMVNRRSLNAPAINNAKEEESSILPAASESSPMLALKMPELLKCLDISKWGQSNNGC